ncbi:hypothetical protein PAMP_024290 [Pampus punctatissimus]
MDFRATSQLLCLCLNIGGGESQSTSSREVERSRNIHTSLIPVHHVVEKSSMPFTQSATDMLDKQCLF